MDYGAFIYLGVYYGSCISGPYPFLYWFRRLQGMVVVVLGYLSTVLSWFSFPMTSLHSSLLRQLGFALDVLQRSQVFVSPGVFFS